LGYDRNIVEALPDAAVESIPGVVNPLSLRDLAAGERAVDLGSEPASTGSLPPARSVPADAWSGST